MNTHLSVTRYGDLAWLVSADNFKPVSLAEAIRRRSIHDANLGSIIDEVVPGARSVLIIANTKTAGNELGMTLKGLLANVDLDRSAAPDPELIRLEVIYDGADLATIAADLGLSTESVVRLHSESRYEVAFCGFAPGFAYLTGLNPRLHLPRLNTPRPQVPAGSVAIADSYSAVYPQASPGGWRLLGRTDTTLFDLAKTQPALLQPGTHVQFVPRGKVNDVSVNSEPT